MSNNASTAAIIYALQLEDSFDTKSFLKMWSDGDFSDLRNYWPDVPEEVFIGADPMHPETKRLAAFEAGPDELRASIRSDIINTPELSIFVDAVRLEAIHQRERWGSENDAGKAPSDWFWLVGYLAGKALHHHAAGNVDKALHHTISTGAALLNWHAAINGDHTSMRPGIAPPAQPEAQKGEK